MSMKRSRSEEIISKRCGVEIYVGQRRTIALAIKKTGVSEGAYAR